MAAANDAKAKAETDVATLTTDKAKLEAEKTTLEKHVADTKLTAQQPCNAPKAYGRGRRNRPWRCHQEADIIAAIELAREGETGVVLG